MSLGMTQDRRHAVPRLPQEPRGRRGHDGAPRRGGLPARRGREAGGRDRRQHLRLHRPGEAGVGGRHPRDGAREGGGSGEAAGGHRLPHPALRRGPAPGDPGDRRHPRDRPGGGDRAGRRWGSHLAGGGGAGPAHLGLRPHRAARALDAAVARLPEDQRGVRLHLLLLHHPDACGAGTAAAGSRTSWRRRRRSRPGACARSSWWRRTRPATGSTTGCATGSPTCCAAWGGWTACAGSA